jgi:hypothetical protein
MQVICAIFAVTPFCAAATGELTDPTRPPDYQAAQPAAVAIPTEVMDFRLSAIRIGPDTRWAIINGKRLTRGDEIGPATVVAIQHTSVTLDYKGRRLSLTLFAGRVKHPATGRDGRTGSGL